MVYRLHGMVVGQRTILFQDVKMQCILILILLWEREYQNKYKHLITKGSFFLHYPDTAAAGRTSNLRLAKEVIVTFLHLPLAVAMLNKGKQISFMFVTRLRSTNLQNRIQIGCNQLMGLVKPFFWKEICFKHLLGGSSFLSDGLLYCYVLQRSCFVIWIV